MKLKKNNIRFQRTVLQCFIFILFLFSSSLSWAIVTEVAGNFSYSKQVYGQNRNNNQVEKKYSTSLAFYLFRYTGIEFDYSYERTITTENDRIIDLASGITIVSKQGVVNNRSYGAGIRQAFSEPGSFLVPHLAIGYAHEIRSGGVSYTLDDSGTQRIFYFPYPVSRNKATYGTFTIQMRLTRGFSIQGSVKTVFEAFKWNKAKDSLYYRAGFSWIF